MSVKIDLTPEIKANLAAPAQAQGMPFDEYLRHVLGEQAGVPVRTKRLSPEERADYWQRTAGGLRDTAPLSDNAISRESIYSGRG